MQTNNKPELIYICGPITKNPDSFREFALAEEKLNGLGFKTINPHEICRHIDKNNFATPREHWVACMRVCLAHITLCDTITTLPNWNESDGATKEVNVARELGFIDVVFYETFIAKYSK